MVSSGVVIMTLLLPSTMIIVIHVNKYRSVPQTVLLKTPELLIPVWNNLLFLISVTLLCPL